MHSPALTESSVATVSKIPFGALAYFGAGASLFVCYGKVVILSVLSGFGLVQLDFNPHLQAVLMWVLGVIAIFGLYRDRRCHGKGHPLVLGAIGVFIIVATLYTHYDQRIEVSGYILLVVAALLNQNARLKRFLAPEVARIVLEENRSAMLESHRSYIVALFCDIRGFTRFSESMDPEEVMDVLQQCHENMGRLSVQRGGTIDHRAGDGQILVSSKAYPAVEDRVEADNLTDLERKDIAKPVQVYEVRGQLT